MLFVYEKSKGCSGETILMRLSKFCIERPITIIMFYGALFILGAISLFNIPISLIPGVSFPGLTVEVEYPGVTPEKIEEIISKPLEEVVSTVGGIEQILSTSEEGKSKTNVLFSHGTDVNLKSLEIRERIDVVASTFPREAQKPVMLRYNPDQRPVMIIIFNSRVKSLSDVREYADRHLKKKIEGIPGVSDVFVAGGQDREILVDCDRQKLLAYNISMGDLLKSLQSTNYDDYTGTVDKDGARLNIYAKGRFTSLYDIRTFEIRTGENGQSVQLGELAKVSLSLREKESSSRVNGKERISLYVYRASNSNLLRLSAEVRETLEKYAFAGITSDVIYDQGRTIRRVLINFLLAAFAGLTISFGLMAYFFKSMYKAMVCIVIILVSFFIVVFFFF